MKKDQQTVSSQGSLLRTLIDGVVVREINNVVTRSGVIVEVFRPEWAAHGFSVNHIAHISFRPGALSAWHFHKLQTDNIMVTEGAMRLVLFDGREDSSTKGMINEFLLSPARPSLVTIPPDLWHGIQNIAGATSNFINYFDRAYNYEDPDEWRLPPDTTEIPYTFPKL